MFTADSLTMCCQMVDVRTEPPWGECQHFSQEENIKKNAFLLEMDHVHYTALVSIVHSHTFSAQIHIIWHC